MTTLSFDGSLNIPTLIGIASAIVTITLFVSSIKGDVKVQKAQITQMNQELGELRRLHEENTKIIQDTTTVIKQVAKSTTDNAKQIKVVKAQAIENKATLLSIPKFLPEKSIIPEPKP